MVRNPKLSSSPIEIGIVVKAFVFEVREPFCANGRRGDTDLGEPTTRRRFAVAELCDRAVPLDDLVVFALDGCDAAGQTFNLYFVAMGAEKEIADIGHLSLSDSETRCVLFD